MIFKTVLVTVLIRITDHLIALVNFATLLVTTVLVLLIQTVFNVTKSFLKIWILDNAGVNKGLTKQEIPVHTVMRPVLHVKEILKLTV